MDTSGYIINDDVLDLLTVTDMVLLDIKFSDKGLYHLHTKADMDTVMYFLAVLEKRNIHTWIRHVLIPDLNDSPEHLLRLKRLLQGYTCIETVEFLPFWRKLCEEKYQTLQIEFPFAKYREGIGKILKEQIVFLHVNFLSFNESAYGNVRNKAF